MTAKCVLMRLQVLRPRARAPTFPPCYATGLPAFGVYFALLDSHPSNKSSQKFTSNAIDTPSTPGK